MKYVSFILCMYFLMTTAYTNINILGTGLFLPYSIGVIGYIKSQIPIQEFRLTGVSGGAWCSLLYAFENDLSDHDKIWNYTVGDTGIKIRIHNNLDVFQKNIEANLKLRYKDIPCNTIRKLPLSIIATRYDNKKLQMYNEKKSEFSDIKDLIDFCLCSSYIPYLSGSLLCKEYDNKYYMDGDIMRDRKFTEYELSPCTITIHRAMWGRKFPISNFIYTDIETSRTLFKQGWEDTEKNRHKLMQCVYPKSLKK